MSMREPDENDGRFGVPVERHPEDEAAARPRLVALHAVTVEAHLHLYEPVRRFYGQVLGLGLPASMMEPAGTLLLVFRNEGPDLLVRLTGQPAIWANRPRVIVEVPQLDTVRQRLLDEQIEHQTLTGWTWPDKRIGLWDPSGNRMEIKRLWTTT